MATDTYQAAFKAFAAHNAFEETGKPSVDSRRLVSFTIADIEHAFYMGMAKGVNEGLTQAAYTITSLSQNNEKLLKRIADLESFGLQGESDVVKTLLLRISKLEAKVGGRS